MPMTGLCGSTCETGSPTPTRVRRPRVRHSHVAAAHGLSSVRTCTTITLRQRAAGSDAEFWVGLQTSAKPPLTHVVIEVGGEFAGSIGIERGDDVHRHSAELGYCAYSLGEALHPVVLAQRHLR